MVVRHETVSTNRSKQLFSVVSSSFLSPYVLHSSPCPRPQEKRAKKRTIIITSFGIHEASSQLEFSRREGRPDSFSAAALASCRHATARVAHFAAAGDSHHLSPLVFLLQHNAVKPGGVEQMFLEEAHRVQREEIGFGTGHEAGIHGTGRATERRGQSDGSNEHTSDGRGGGADDSQLGTGGASICDNSERRGVFLVEDGRRKPPCNRPIAPDESREHAGVVEAKVLWNLIALVDREHSSLSPATFQAIRNENLEATEPSGVAWELDVDAGMDVPGPALLGADAVWSRLQEAGSSQDECLSPPCGNVSKCFCSQW